LAALAFAPRCEAGTGGIFSSTNQTRKKIQPILPIETPTALPDKSVVKPTISIPATPGTVFLDSKKSGKSDGSLNGDVQLHDLQQTLSGSGEAPSGSLNSSNPASATSSGSSISTGPTLTGSSLTGSTSANPNKSGNANIGEIQLRGLTGSASISAPPATGSVDSFFQLNQSAANLPPQFSAPAKKSTGGAPFRFFWHVMDNAGVPMFFGKSDDDLDPSLRQGYAGTISVESKYPKPNQDPGVGASSAPTPQSQGSHKIPEGELEGTDSWVKDNEQMP
jgi:hypothetical protein